MIRTALVILLSITSVPAAAGVAEDRAALARLQAEDLRLQTIGWKLAVGNARFCDARPAIGLLLQDMANYARPARMRAAAGIGGDVAAQAVVPGSPAALAGLAANNEILSIEGRAMAALPAAKAGDWRRLTGLHGSLDAALARNGSVHVAWREGTQERAATIRGTPACSTRFELLDSGGRAAADGTRVVIGRKFAGFAYPEEELAAAVAHEFAHNLFAHRAWLKSAGRKARNVRLTEREADRLMPWLLANAGYPPDAAVRFFRKWGPRHDGWIFRGPTHDGWDERAAFVEGELPLVAQRIASEGAADWRTHFRRETAR